MVVQNYRNKMSKVIKIITKLPKLHHKIKSKLCTKLLVIKIIGFLINFDNNNFDNLIDNFDNF